ncbi:MAG: aldo/keto reductase [Ardenticatenaceae bacterium]|nr:aldo/keto reductase [Ardenticatenaceae bacterium]
MKYRLLGRTGLLVSELCLGTMTFFGKGFWEVVGKQGQDLANEIVARSLDAGINFIDTANVYSFGESETMLGKALAGRLRDEVIIATKVRSRMSDEVNNVGLSRHQIMRSVEASLKRLNTDYIDLYQIHGFDPVTPLDETLRALDDLVHQGKVRYIGASNLAAWQLMKALAYSEQHQLARFESLQAYYTIAGRDLERELVPLVQDQQVGVMVWSPLAGGLLTGKFDREGNGPEGTRRASFDFPPVNKERAFDCVDVMREVAEEQGVSVPQIALAWLLHQSAVTSVIIGAKRMEQLEDNLNAVTISLTADQLQRLDAVSQLPPEYPQWMLARQAGGRLPE